MAGKMMEFAFKIGGQVSAGFNAAFAAANSAMQRGGANTAKLKEEQKALGAEMGRLKSQQTVLNAAFKSGQISQQTYNSELDQLKTKMNSTAAAQDKLKVSIEKAGAAAKAQKSMDKAFNANPVRAFGGAVTGVTSKVSNLASKLSSMAAFAAGGFGLAALASGAIEAGENVYQLSNKLHLSSAEANQLNRIITMTGGDTDVAAKSFMRLDKTFTSSGKAAEGLKAMLQQYGVSLTDSNGKLLPLNEQLKNLSAGYKAASAAGQEQEFVMATLGPRGMELVKTLQDYDEAAETASKVKGVGLDVNQMHQLNLNMKLMKAQGAQLGLAVTSAFAPLLQQILPMLLPQLQQLSSWIATNKDAIATFAIEGMKFFALYQGVSMLTNGIRTMGAAWRYAKAGANAASTVMSAIGGPWTLAIMAIVAVIYLLYTNWDTITAAMKAVWTATVSTLTAVWDGFVAAWNTIVAGLSATWTTIVDTLSAAWDSFTSGLSAAWSAVCSAVSAIWNGFVNTLSAGWNLLKTGVMAYINIWLNLPTYILFAIGFIIGAVSQLPSAIGSAISAAINWLMNLPAAVYTAAASFLAAAIAWGAQAYATVTGWMSNLVNNAVNWLMNLPSACVEAGAAFVSAAENWASEAYNAIINWISKIPSAVSDYIRNAWANIKATISASISIGSGGAYASGGLITSPHLGLVGEAGPEMIIPLTNKSRGMELWQQTGSLLGASRSGSGAGTINIQGSPINITGSTNPQETAALVQQAVEQSNENLLSQLPKILSEMQNNSRRTSFA